MRERLLQVVVGIVSAIAMAVALAVFAGTSVDAESPTARVHTVHIRKMLFDPQTIEIAPGDAVTWINDDMFLHAVKATASDSAWLSKDLPPHASWTRTFVEGARYVCPYHPTMTGEIKVHSG